MKNATRWLVFGLAFVLTMLAFGAAYTLRQNARRPDKILETYGRVEADSVAPDGTHHTVSRIRTIGAFHLTDQLGRPFTEAQTKGHIYVADFFFTTCQSICIPMGNHMEELVGQFKDDPDILFVSHTVDPETDSVPVLKAYADSHHAPADKWFLLTGSKKEIYALARQDYQVTALQGDGGPDDFVHTQNFALVDKLGRIRGYYDGTQKAEMDKLVKDIRVLKQEDTEEEE